MHSEGDDRVIARLTAAPAGLSAMALAKASLRSRARRHSIDALNMIGLAIAARLCGQQIIEPTRTNQFRLRQRENRTMIEDGRAFGATIALKHILALLERKGIVGTNELTDALDAAQAELNQISSRPGVIASEAVAEAGRGIGLLYVRSSPTGRS